MVVQTRTDVRRNRLLYILTIILSIAVLITAILQYSESSDSMRAVFLVLSIAGFALNYSFRFPALRSSPTQQRHSDSQRRRDGCRDQCHA